MSTVLDWGQYSFSYNAHKFQDIPFNIYMYILL